MATFDDTHEDSPNADSVGGAASGGAATPGGGATLGDDCLAPEGAVSLPATERPAIAAIQSPEESEEHQPAMTCPCCGSVVGSRQPAWGRGQDAAQSRWLGWWAFAGLGLLMAWTGVFVATRTLPRFAGVRDVFQLDLPVETGWILRNGWVQPLPGCVLAVVGLTGLLSKRARPGLAGFGVLVMIGGIVLLILTWLSLLVPPLVYT